MAACGGLQWLQLHAVVFPPPSALPCLADAAAATASLSEYHALLNSLPAARRAVVEPVVSAAVQAHGSDPYVCAISLLTLLDEQPTLDGASLSSSVIRLIQIGARPSEAITQVGKDLVAEQSRLSAALKSIQKAAQRRKCAAI